MTYSRGYKYMMIAYDFDYNNILAEPLKSQTGLHIKSANQKIEIYCAAAASDLSCMS